MYTSKSGNMQPVYFGLRLVCCLVTTCAICLPAKEDKGPECGRTVDVAIIGAGPAGSYFAYRLRDAGLNIELFEYSDRIGGRLYTTTLPQIPDVNLELGGMRFVDGEHVRVQRLVEEFNLTAIEFTEGFGRYERKKYFLRGQILTPDEVSDGVVPYNLSPEEKANQGRLAEYYLEQLTGFNGTLTAELAFELKAKDGRELYKLTLDEALALVATAEGRQFLKDSMPLTDSAFNSDISTVDYFIDQLAFTAHDALILTLKDGMSSIPRSLVNAFLTSSPRHKLSVNRKLEEIIRNDDSGYILSLRKTTTVDGLTQEEGEEESVCAKKVVLAIPQFALTKLKWTPLSSPKIQEALFAVTPAKASKVFLAFPKAWWLNCIENCTYMITSDAPFRQTYDWKFSHVSGDYVLLASYAEGNVTLYQQGLNSEGELATGSSPGYNKVTKRLEEELLHYLSQAFDVDESYLPETTAAISQFWTSYPFGGGWTSLRAGYNFTDVRQTIQRPSSSDEVYIVGSDLSFIGKTTWTEGALTTVDLVYDKYFNLSMQG